MLITRVPPSVAELVHRALADTSFLSQIAGAPAHLVKTYAEIAASLAAEQWEAERRELIGLSLPLELIAEVAQALVAHATELPEVKEAELYAAIMKVERALDGLASARSDIKGKLPLAAAEAFMDDVEHHFDVLRIKLTRARDVMQSTIDRLIALGAV